MANEKFKVKFGLAVGDTAATIDGTTGNIAMGTNLTTIGATNLVLNTNNGTNSGQIQITQGAASNILITPNTTGDVYLESDTVFVGDNNSAATISTYGNASLTISNGSGSNNIVIDPSSGTTVNDGHMILGQLNTAAILTTNGTGNLDIRTGSWPTSANITLADGVNGNITVTTNGTGEVVINAKTDVDELQVDNININGNTISSTDTNGNITLDPNGTGSVALTLADGGNLTNTRNYVKGVIRNSTLAAAGEIWAFNSTGPVSPYQGISIDNSADTTTGPGTVLRSFSGGAVAGAGTRGRLVFEKARGTSASPTAVQSGDFLGSIDATGYSSTGWVNDTQPASPAFFGFIASENWVSNTNLGTSFTLSQAPQATTITSAANNAITLQIQPESAVMRSNRLSFSQATSVGFTATGCSTSGTTLTIGTVTAGTVAVGQVLQVSGPTNGHYIIANISGSGSGSTWQISGSPGTLSGLTIIGNLGYWGTVPATSSTTDILQDLRLVKNTIKSSNGTTNITTGATAVTMNKPVTIAGSTSGSVTLDAGATPAAQTYTLPQAYPTANNQVLVSTTGGVTSWVSTNSLAANYLDANWTTAIGTLTANTIYGIPLTSLSATNITIATGAIPIDNATATGPTRITFAQTGRYNLQFSIQIANADSAEQDLDVWLRKNTADIADSNTQITVIKQQGGNPGKNIMALNLLLNVTSVGDYYELVYATTDPDCKPETIAGISTPYVRPSAPSIIVTVTPVGA